MTTAPAYIDIHWRQCW